MADGTHIEWSEATLNVVTGCTRVSEGCDHCYIERTPPFRMAGRKFDKPGVGGATGVQLHPDRLTLPLKWRKPRRIFVNSLADLFHDDVPDDLIAELFAVMMLASQHTFQVLTKRPARMRALLTNPLFRGTVEHTCYALVNGGHTGNAVLNGTRWPLSNVWLGVSAENQKWADIRVPLLLDTPAAVRWLSCEPLLGPVDLGAISHHSYVSDALLGESWQHGVIGQDEPRVTSHIDWVVVGGESGPGARPMLPDWARSLRDQCQDAGVPFFFKQWGEHRWVAGSRYDQETQCWVDDGVEPQRVGKHAAGRKLDGRTHNEYPEVRAAVEAVTSDGR